MNRMGRMAVEPTLEDMVARREQQKIQPKAQGSTRWYSRKLLIKGVASFEKEGRAHLFSHLQCS